MTDEGGGSAVVLLGAAVQHIISEFGLLRYLNGKQAWFVGADKTYDHVGSDLASCRKMQGERFLECVR
jgi:hypothetical protein